VSVVEPILIATCGNERAGDDSFGPRVARALGRAEIGGAEIVELGMNPTGLIDRLEGRRALILIDAAEPAGLPAGRLLEFDWNAPDRPPLRAERCVSTHGMSLADQLELARALGRIPPVVRIVAVTSGSTRMGDAPSADILRQMGPAVQRVCALVCTLAPSSHQQRSVNTGICRTRGSHSDPASQISDHGSDRGQRPRPAPVIQDSHATGGLCV
jgi:hydrogenase maturation protease